MITFKKYIKERVELPAKSDSMQIDRKDMPQIDHKDLKGFLSFLEKKDIVYKTKSVKSDSLSPTQHQFHVAKIKSIMDKMEDGKYDHKPIIVSSDQYVMDGHHRWIAHTNLELPIDVIQVSLKAKELIDLMMEYPKSYTEKLYESYDLILTESGEVCSVITKSHMDAFEKIVDRLFAKFKIDFDFTKHFRERMSDGRNKPCIDIKELANMIQKIYKKKTAGNNIFAKHRDTEAVVKDIQSDLNMPVAIEYDRKNDQLKVVSKTIMRKKNFSTSNPQIKV